VANIASLSGRIAALPQDAFFAPNLSIVREIAHHARMAGVSPQDARRAAVEALAAVGLDDAIDKRGGQLSHGMAKRAGLAQCLVGRPDLVLLDEPTAGLDPRHARTVRDIIQQLGTRATVIVSSHNLAEIEDVCTHGAILDRGRLTVEGTIDALTNRGEIVRIELTSTSTIPLPKIAALPCVATARIEQARFVEVQGQQGLPSEEVIGAVLAELLAAKCGILGVERGRSLERAFLDLTAGSEAP
jgi:ABC-type multidrug transport system ATPase subunit